MKWQVCQINNNHLLACKSEKTGMEYYIFDSYSIIVYATKITSFFDSRKLKKPLEYMGNGRTKHMIKHFDVIKHVNVNKFYSSKL